MSTTAIVGTVATPSLNTNAPTNRGVPRPRTLEELTRTLQNEARHALHRRFTNWCQAEDDKRVPADQRKSCTHEGCWKKVPAPAMNEQVAICERVGVPIQAVFGIRDRNTITFRSS